MRARSHTRLRWTPRILGGVVCLFLTLFAADATGVVDTLMHLAPVAAVAAILAVGWRWPWLGGLGFILVAAAYAGAAWRHPSWIAGIAGPLVVVGVLFLASWRLHRPASVPA